MSRVFPMDLRPQAHDIIRTWLFYTVVRAHLEHDSLPWKNTTISGWVFDPDRKKMSKSKGNVVTPMHVIERYGADAVRYWACNGRMGRDTAFDENQMKVGRRLAIKLLNASKFALSNAEGASDDAEITEPLDAAMLARLAELVDDVTEAFDRFDYARALEITETFFWFFTDNYIELVKGRTYGSRGDSGRDSGRAALCLAIETLLKLFAPHVPFVTEEIWSWWKDGSVHRAEWPSGEIRADPRKGGKHRRRVSLRGCQRGLRGDPAIQERLEPLIGRSGRQGRRAGHGGAPIAILSRSLSGREGRGPRR